jgi:hypothetical protein
MTGPRRWPRWAAPSVAAAALLLLTACPGTKSIKELLDDPSRYEGETVRIAGRVTESIGVLGVGGYRVDDGTGTLTVVLQSGGASPRVGANVGVEGTFRSAATVGTLTVAALLEKDRRVQ